LLGQWKSDDPSGEMVGFKVNGSEIGVEQIVGKTGGVAGDSSFVILQFQCS
jgi:hypothetical protein